MKMLLATALTLVVCVATHADDLGQLIPPAVISDPAPDSVHPPRSAQALVPSHPSRLGASVNLCGGMICPLAVWEDTLRGHFPSLR